MADYVVQELVLFTANHLPLRQVDQEQDYYLNQYIRLYKL